MESDLSDAYEGVYSSSKEILKNKQRHLFCNMLDLLSNTIKTTGIPTCKIGIDDLAKFWLGEILPLMFDNDHAIQCSAIAALEQGVPAFDLPLIHESSSWAALKKTIASNLPLLHKMRETGNPNWQQIWCVLVRIFNEEILKGANIINSFLTVVELGFRSPENTVRSEAFYCWRQLIEIFSTNNELSSRKRLKLICIPLKSSQSKSPHLAIIKLRVWWYLITCLGPHLDQQFEAVVEPFLAFTFGTATGDESGAAQQYECVRDLALPCLVALLSDETNEFLQRFLRDHKLETLCQPSPLLSTTMSKRHWQSILDAALGGVVLLSHNDVTLELAEHQLLNLLLRLVLTALFKFAVAPCIVQLCKELAKILKTNPRPAILVLNMIASEGLAPNDVALESVANDPNVLGALVRLIIAAKAVVPNAILNRCVERVFAANSSDDSKQQWRQLVCFTEIVVQCDADVSYIEPMMIAWLHISQALLKYLRENRLDYRSKENAVIINRWLLWPLRNGIGTGRPADDNHFVPTWRLLLNTGHNAPNRRNFLNEVKNALQAMLPEQKHFPDLLDAYANALIKLAAARNSNHFEGFFELLYDALKQTEQARMIETYLNTVRNIVVTLKLRELPMLFDFIKETVKIVIRIEKKCNVEKAFLEEWKRAILEKIRSHTNKSFGTQIKAMFQDKNDFVIIPAVWSLDPDKLTERQKERFAEKADIPALYNDMSQSQDSSMKPWTPKKIVIAKNKQAEIAIDGSPLPEPSAANVKDSELLSTPLSVTVSPQQVTVENTNCTRGTELALLKAPQTDAETMAVADDIGSFADFDQAGQCMHNLNDNSPKTRQLSPSPVAPATSADATSLLECELNQAQSSKQNDAAPKQMVLPQPENHFVDQNASLKAEQYEAKQQPAENAVSAPEQNTCTLFSDVTVPKEVSPKKCKFIPLAVLTSPPDRRVTNNSSSPTLRHKPSAHLTGRGAQLINMIRNKKIDVSTQGTPTRSSAAKTDTLGEIATPTMDHLDLSGAEHLTSTPIQPKDLLVFSKRLPSPTASPSVSILKRKMQCDSFEDTPVELSALKRKRVSFHDPPVSVTMEYTRDSGESKLKPKRCLLLDKILVGQSASVDARCALKRRSKLDSMVEIEKYASVQDSVDVAIAPIASVGFMLCKETLTEEDAISKYTQATCRAYLTKPNIDSPTTSKSSGSAVETTNNAESGVDAEMLTPEMALDKVLDSFAIDAVLEKFFEVKSAATIPMASTLTKFISQCMNDQSKIKTSVLETLSENHSKDFLDHAVQENLSSVVCDRLNLNSVIDYVCAKSKINTNCRNNLLQEIPEILKYTKSNSDRAGFIENVLRNSNFPDDIILHLISLLIEMRSRTAAGNAEIVSESAVDSSSNL